MYCYIVIVVQNNANDIQNDKDAYYWQSVTNNDK